MSTWSWPFSRPITRSGGRTRPQTLALAEEAYARRPGVHAADILAWARYRVGDLEGAWSASEEARRLGTQDALMFFHAGVIADARGDTAAARDFLTTALAIDPAFSLRYAPEARDHPDPARRRRRVAG